RRLIWSTACGACCIRGRSCTMNWSDIFLLCFAIGALWSFASLLLGGMHLGHSGNAHAHVHVHGIHAHGHSTAHMVGPAAGLEAWLIPAARQYIWRGSEASAIC